MAKAFDCKTVIALALGSLNPIVWKKKFAVWNRRA